MTAPFIVIRTFTIKEGKLEGFKQFLNELFNFIETNEPRLLAINAYVNEDGTEVTFIQVHPDAASMELHEKVTHEYTKQARREFLDATTSLQVYGKLSDILLEGTRQLAGTGVPLSIKPEHLGGFTRLSATAG